MSPFQGLIGAMLVAYKVILKSGRDCTVMLTFQDQAGECHEVVVSFKEHHAPNEHVWELKTRVHGGGAKFTCECGAHMFQPTTTGLADAEEEE